MATKKGGKKGSGKIATKPRKPNKPKKTGKKR